jgi:voltage-gated potassium channel
MLVKELVFSLLAILSVGTLIYEFVGNPTTAEIQFIMRFDFVVAIIFLIDFIWQFHFAKNKRKFLRHNWYLLLASIPLVDSLTEILRVLRILPLIRLIRAGEHLRYASELVLENQ